MREPEYRGPGRNARLLKYSLEGVFWAEGKEKRGIKQLEEIAGGGNRLVPIERNWRRASRVKEAERILGEKDFYIKKNCWSQRADCMRTQSSQQRGDLRGEPERGGRGRISGRGKSSNGDGTKRIPYQRIEVEDLNRKALKNGTTRGGERTNGWGERISRWRV